METIMELTKKLRMRSHEINNNLSDCDDFLNKFYHRVERGEFDDFKKTEYREEIELLKGVLLIRRELKQELRYLGWKDNNGTIENFKGWIRVVGSAIEREESLDEDRQDR